MNFTKLESKDLSSREMDGVIQQSILSAIVKMAANGMGFNGISKLKREIDSISATLYSLVILKCDSDNEISKKTFNELKDQATKTFNNFMESLNMIKTED